MISDKEMDIFGGKTMLSWIDECVERIKKDIQTIFKDEKIDIYHIDMTDIKSFKKSIEEYAKRHKNAKIKASAFVVTTEGDSEEYSFEQ